MKKIILSFILLMTPMVLFSWATPHLPEWRVIDATKFNENFEYLLKRTAIHKPQWIAVGETINDALEKFNHIVISGTCNENIEIDASVNPQKMLILEELLEMLGMIKSLQAIQTMPPFIYLFQCM